METNITNPSPVQPPQNKPQTSGRTPSPKGRGETTQYLQPLVAAGLEPDQAQVYEILLKNGPLKAGRVALKSTLKRGLVYKILDELVGSGLVIKNEPTGKVAVFEPAHPLKIKEFAEAREQKLKTAQLALDGILGNLTSDYNLALNKPGVQFFEGVEGVTKVLDDSLGAKNGILAYLDFEALNRYLPDVNKHYMQKRSRLNIFKRMIAVDSTYVRTNLKSLPKISEVRVIEKGAPFATDMQIYNNKVSYVTLDEKKMIGVIIEDERIANMHRTLFEFSWNKAIKI